MCDRLHFYFLYAALAPLYEDGVRMGEAVKHLYADVVQKLCSTQCFLSCLGHSGLNYAVRKSISAFRARERQVRVHLLIHRALLYLGAVSLSSILLPHAPEVS